MLVFTCFLDTATSMLLCCLRGRFALRASDPLPRFLDALQSSIVVSNPGLLLLSCLPAVSCNECHSCVKRTCVLLHF